MSGPGARDDPGGQHRGRLASIRERDSSSSTAPLAPGEDSLSAAAQDVARERNEARKARRRKKRPPQRVLDFKPVPRVDDADDDIDVHLLPGPDQEQPEPASPRNAAPHLPLPPASASLPWVLVPPASPPKAPRAKARQDAPRPHVAIEMAPMPAAVQMPQLLDSPRQLVLDTPPGPPTPGATVKQQAVMTGDSTTHLLSPRPVSDVTPEPDVEQGNGQPVSAASSRQWPRRPTQPSFVWRPHTSRPQPTRTKPPRGRPLVAEAVDCCFGWVGPALKKVGNAWAWVRGKLEGTWQLALLQLLVYTAAWGLHFASLCLSAWALVELRKVRTEWFAVGMLLLVASLLLAATMAASKGHWLRHRMRRQPQPGAQQEPPSCGGWLLGKWEALKAAASPRSLSKTGIITNSPPRLPLVRYAGALVATAGLQLVEAAVCAPLVLAFDLATAIWRLTHSATACVWAASGASLTPLTRAAEAAGWRLAEYEADRLELGGLLHAAPQALLLLYAHLCLFTVPFPEFKNAQRPPASLLRGALAACLGSVVCAVPGGLRRLEVGASLMQLRPGGNLLRTVVDVVLHYWDVASDVAVLVTVSRRLGTAHWAFRVLLVFLLLQYPLSALLLGAPAWADRLRDELRTAAWRPRDGAGAATRAAARVVDAAYGAWLVAHGWALATVALPLLDMLAHAYLLQAALWACLPPLVGPRAGSGWQVAHSLHVVVLGAFLPLLAALNGALGALLAAPGARCVFPLECWGSHDAWTLEVAAAAMQGDAPALAEAVARYGMPLQRRRQRRAPGTWWRATSSARREADETARGRGVAVTEWAAHYRFARVPVEVAAEAVPQVVVQAVLLARALGRAGTNQRPPSEVLVLMVSIASSASSVAKVAVEVADAAASVGLDSVQGLLQLVRQRGSPHVSSHAIGLYVSRSSSAASASALRGGSSAGGAALAAAAAAGPAAAGGALRAVPGAAVTVRLQHSTAMQNNTLLRAAVDRLAPQHPALCLEGAELHQAEGQPRLLLGKALTDERLEQAAKLAHLTHLVLDGCFLGPRSLKELVDVVVACPHVRHFTLLRAEWAEHPDGDYTREQLATLLCTPRAASDTVRLKLTTDATVLDHVPRGTSTPAVGRLAASAVLEVVGLLRDWQRVKQLALCCSTAHEHPCRLRVALRAETLSGAVAPQQQQQHAGDVGAAVAAGGAAEGAALAEGLSLALFPAQLVTVVCCRLGAVDVGCLRQLAELRREVLRLELLQGPPGRGGAAGDGGEGQPGAGVLGELAELLAYSEERRTVWLSRLVLHVGAAMPPEWWAALQRVLRGAGHSLLELQLHLAPGTCPSGDAVCGLLDAVAAARPRALAVLQLSGLHRAGGPAGASGRLVGALERLVNAARGQLVVLAARRCGLADGDAGRVADLLVEPLPELQALDLSDNHLSAAACGDLLAQALAEGGGGGGGGGRHPKLSEVVLDFNGAELLAHPGVQRLSLPQPSPEGSGSGGSGGLRRRRQLLLSALTV